MQKHRRALKDEGKEDLSIGFVIYKLPEDYKVCLRDFSRKDLKCDIDFQASKKLDEKYFRYNPHNGRSDNFVNAREVVKAFNLPAGRYVVIPSTYSPGSSGEFYLRVFTEIPSIGDAIDDRDTDIESVAEIDEVNPVPIEEETLSIRQKKIENERSDQHDHRHQLFRIKTDFSEITIRLIEAKN